jgi:hypothetical protein
MYGSQPDDGRAKLGSAELAEVLLSLFLRQANFG